ncbi:hypothetical protein EDD16DRAFT_1241879 [Pisolithus croceorrhizus]|nr:hypothetical protein EDD16DRAFT_1241879 [Pisolithus croceorrhizus]
MTMERSSTDLKSALRIRCGSALLSDVIGAIITILMRIYPESEFGLQYYGKLLGSIMLAGVQNLTHSVPRLTYLRYCVWYACPWMHFGLQAPHGPCSFLVLGCPFSSGAWASGWGGITVLIGIFFSCLALVLVQEPLRPHFCFRTDRERSCP